MIIECQNIRLRGIERSDLSDLRAWRNHDDVRRFLFDRRTISEKDQMEWFDGLDRRNDLHLMIEENGSAHGLLQVKEYDPAKLTCTSAIFIRPDQASSPLPAVASILLTEFGFGPLGIRRVSAEIIDGNTAALTLNRIIGFRSQKNQVDRHQLSMTPSDYLENRTRLLRVVQVYLNTDTLRLSVTRSDDESFIGRIDPGLSRLPDRPDVVW